MLLFDNEKSKIDVNEMLKNVMEIKNRRKLK